MNVVSVYKGEEREGDPGSRVMMMLGPGVVCGQGPGSGVISVAATSPDC